MLLCSLITEEIFRDAEKLKTLSSYPEQIWIVVARFIAGVVLHMSL